MFSPVAYDSIWISYPSLPLLWMASSSVMPSSTLKASQSIFDFSSVLIFCFFPPMRPKMLDMPAGRLPLQPERKQLTCVHTHTHTHTGIFTILFIHSSIHPRLHSPLLPVSCLYLITVSKKWLGQSREVDQTCLLDFWSSVFPSDWHSDIQQLLSVWPGGSGWNH